MKNILSIQSHVAYGYVGNRAAVFPLQRLGHEVSAINTVQFSNHTGYGSWTGDIFPATHIAGIIDGLEKKHVLEQLDAILSGYIGDASLGQVILETVKQIKSFNANNIYCCDPVLGDIGRGVFVKPGVADFFKHEALALADILTPNQFELNYLTDIPIYTLEDALNACAHLRSRGPQIIVVTSLIREEKKYQNVIEVLVDTATQSWIIETPRLDLPIPPNGAGDATAAIFLAKYLETRNVAQALQHTISAIYAIFEKTFKAGTRELQLIAAQDEIVSPTQLFAVEQIR